ncbi:MAG: hypothetical protein FJ368_03235 [Pelagibacterales bacterium]|nr:hypothetical protein [Pelagibacterales bacterium]
MKIFTTLKKKLIRILFIKKYPFHRVSIFLLKKIIGLKKDELAIVSMFHSGETYMIAAMIDSIRKKFGIEKPVVLVGSKNYHGQIAEMFPDQIKKYYQISGDIALCLQERRDIKKNEIFALYNEKIWKYFKARSDLKQLDYVKQIIFVEPETKLLNPTISEEVKLEAKRKFDELNLIKGKTVFLSPEAISVKVLPNDFWQNLADQINAKGYKVFLNIIGRENNIKNSVSGFLTLQEAIAFVELCGNVVALRSGLCDIVISSNTKFQIIYPDEKSLEKYSFSHYSDHKNKITEYVFDELNWKKLTEQIFKKIFV